MFAWVGGGTGRVVRMPLCPFVEFHQKITISICRVFYKSSILYLHNKIQGAIHALFSEG